MDDLIDLAGSGVSLAVREMCCRIATDSASFTRAAGNLSRLAQLKLSDEKLRQLAESEGRAVLHWQEHEQLELDFEPRCCLTDKTGDGSIRSLYVGIHVRFGAEGLDVGSGPTESMCKSLSRRMKGTGMRWSADNAESIVALEALQQSDLWPNYWSTRLAA